MAGPHRHPAHTPPSRLARQIAAGVAAAICAALLLPAPAAAAESSLYNISGRGWGHGIGMSQWGAYGYAKHGWPYRQILSHYYTGITFGKVTNRTIRVLLNEGQTSVRVSSAAPFHAKWGTQQLDIAKNAAAMVTWSAGAYQLAVGAETYRSTTPVLFTPGSSRLLLVNPNMSGLPSANMHYRGNLRVLHFTGGLSVINAIRVEDYLRGVVPREVPSSWPAAALKAQAVAARSFAATHFGSAGAFDVYCDTRSQAYNGADGEAASTNAAIDATRGVVPIYDGKPITACFFSTSGGHTENVENVWGTGAIPYLRGVEDPYDTYSPYHIWPDNPIRKTAAAVQAGLGATYAPAGVTQTIYVVKRGVSPRVVSAYVVASGGVKAVSGAILRVRLGLRDTWFDVRTLSVDPAASPLTTITYGDAFSLAGRVFPQLTEDEQLVLHFRQGGGAWGTRVVAADALTAGSVRLTATLKAKYTVYAVPITPAARSTYYFSVGPARSPQTSIAVRPAVTLKAPAEAVLAGQQVTFDATVAPASLAGSPVTLELQTADGWTTAGSGTLDQAGACSIGWTAGAPGTYSFRLRVPAAQGLSTGLSAVVELTVDPAPSPSPSPRRLLPLL